MLTEPLSHQPQDDPSTQPSCHHPHALSPPSHELSSIALAPYQPRLSPASSAPLPLHPAFPSIDVHSASSTSTAPPPLRWYQRPLVRPLLRRFFFILLLLSLSSSSLFSWRATRRRYGDWLSSLQPYPQLPVLLLLLTCSAWMSLLPGSFGVLCLITTAFPWHLSLPLCCLCSILATAINITLHRTRLTSTLTTLGRYIPYLHPTPPSPGLLRCVALLPFTTTFLLRLPYLGLAAISRRLALTPIHPVPYLLASALGVLPGCVVWAVVSGEVVTVLEWVSGLEVGERVGMVLVLVVGFTAFVSAMVGAVKWRLRVVVRREAIRRRRTAAVVAAAAKRKGKEATRSGAKGQLTMRESGDDVA